MEKERGLAVLPADLQRHLGLRLYDPHFADRRFAAGKTGHGLRR